MTKKCAGRIFCTVLSLISSDAVTQCAEPKTADRAELTLFDGSDWSGWLMEVPFEQTDKTKYWTVDDGALKSTGKSHLGLANCETHFVGDFDITFEWMCRPPNLNDNPFGKNMDDFGNAFWISTVRPAGAKREVQVSYGCGVGDAAVMLVGDFAPTTNGSHVDSRCVSTASSVDGTDLYNKWNEMRIVWNQGTFTHWVNGEKAVEKRLEGIKEADGAPSVIAARYLKLKERGFQLALRDTSGRTKFRNIRVTRPQSLSPAQLRVGMTKAQVNWFCGPPTNDFREALWSYDGRVQVFFADDGTLVSVRAMADP